MFDAVHGLALFLVSMVAFRFLGVHRGGENGRVGPLAATTATVENPEVAVVVCRGTDPRRSSGAI
jgi:hypothetical protein